MYTYPLTRKVSIVYEDCRAGSKMFEERQPGKGIGENVGVFKVELNLICRSRENGTWNG